MKKQLLTISALLALTCIVLATTVIPPSFNDLVTQAELIFQGTVADVRSEWVGEGGQRHIRTLVTFNVEDVVKGKPGKQITLDMLGGTVGAETMEVTDAPKFKIGDRDILFVQNNGTQFVPLVGIMHGRFHVRKDESGREAVFTDNGAPLTSLDQIGREDDRAAAVSGAALSVQDFKQAIQTRAAHLPQ